MSELKKAHENGTLKDLVPAGQRVMAVIPTDIDQSYRLAQVIVAANMAPDSYERSVEKVLVGILHGLEVGFTPMAALQSIAIINGHPSIYGDGALGLVHASGLLEDMHESIQGAGEGMIAKCELKRKDRPTPIIREFSMSDAERAQLTGKDNWKKYPQRMLQMRARSWAMRDGFADVLKGLHIAEEMLDMTFVQTPDGTFAPPPQREDFKDGYTIYFPDGLVNEGLDLESMGKNIIEAFRECQNMEQLQAMWNDNKVDDVRSDLAAAGHEEIVALIHQMWEGKQQDFGAQEEQEWQDGGS